MVRSARKTAIDTTIVAWGVASAVREGYYRESMATALAALLRQPDLLLLLDEHKAANAALVVERDRLKIALTKIAALSDGPPDGEVMYNEIIASGLDSTDAEQAIGHAGASWYAAEIARIALCAPAKEYVK